MEDWASCKLHLDIQVSGANLWKKTWQGTARCSLLLIWIRTRLVSSRACPLHSVWWGRSTSCHFVHCRWYCHPKSMSRNCGKTWAKERCCHLHIYQCITWGVSLRALPTPKVNQEASPLAWIASRMDPIGSAYPSFRKRYRISFPGITGGWPTVGHT